MNPGWKIRTEFWSEILYGAPAGVIGWSFGQKNVSELLGEVDGDVVGRSERGCCLIQRMGPAW